MTIRVTVPDADEPIVNEDKTATQVMRALYTGAAELVNAVSPVVPRFASLAAADAVFKNPVDGTIALPDGSLAMFTGEGLGVFNASDGLWHKSADDELIT